MMGILIILILVLVYITLKQNNKPAIYLNLDLNKLNNTPGDEKCSQEYEKKIKEIQSQYDTQKKRADELYMKYANPDPNAIENAWEEVYAYPKGDDKFTMKMLDTGSRAQESQTNRALWSKNSMIPYLATELDMHENSIWWENDALEHSF